MSTFQKIVIVGNTGNDPETKHFENGGQLTNLSVATTETWKNKQTGEKQSLTEWHRVTFNGKLSEIVDKYVKKGDKILVEGKLRTRKWTGQDNIERYTTEIVAREMTMLGSPSGSTNRENGGSAVDAYQSKQQNQGHAGDQFLAGQTDKPSTTEDEHDDLPFS